MAISGDGVPSTTGGDQSYIVSIIRQASSIYTQYDLVQQHMSPDSFMPDSLNPAVRSLIEAVHELRPVLSSVCRQFYLDNAGTAIRQDCAIYTIVIYLLLFRLGQALRPDPIIAILATVHVNPVKMALLGKFVCLGDLDGRGKLASLLSRHFDYSHVNEEILKPLRRWQSHFREWIEDAMRLPSVDKTTSTLRKRITKTKAFALSGGDIPPMCNIDHELIDTRCGKRSMLFNKWFGPRLEMIEREKDQRRREMLMKVTNRNKKAHESAPSLRVSRKVNHSVPECIPSALVMYHPVPVSREPPPQTIWCRSALLREHSLFQQSQQRLNMALKTYEIDRLDDRPYQVWREQCEAHDQQKRKDLILERKRDQLQQRQALRQSLAVSFHDKQQMARSIDEQQQRLLEARREHDQIASDIRRRVVASVRAGRRHGPNNSPGASYSTAMHDGTTCNDTDGRAHSADGSSLSHVRRQKAAMTEKRLAECRDIVRRVRSMEVSARDNVASCRHTFDPSTTAGFLLLSEMSLYETRLRGQNKREDDQRHFQEKRDLVAEQRRIQGQRMKAITGSVLATREKRAADSFGRIQDKRAARYHASDQRWVQENQTFVDCTHHRVERDAARADRLRLNRSPGLMTQQQHDDSVEHERRSQRMIGYGEDAAERSMNVNQRNKMVGISTFKKIQRQELLERDQVCAKKTAETLLIRSKVDNDLLSSKFRCNQQKMKKKQAKAAMVVRIQSHENRRTQPEQKISSSN